jgi:hypothetical protein
MALRTSAEIKVKIIALEAKIAKAEDQQASTSGGPAQGQHTQRGDLSAMYRELDRLEKLYAKVEAQEQGPAVPSLVQFEAPS